MKYTLRFSAILATILVVVSCARQGTPSGGVRDETPPGFIRAFPDTLSTNVDVNIKEILIDFDEYILLKDYNKQVVISPPFQKTPIVTPMAMAKRSLSMKLTEPLLPNTTYSFNFGNAIQDFNEGNPLSNFNYVFSTGDYIDSLSVSGRITSAYNFDQPTKTLVGLYKIDDKYNDSIVLQKKPYYIARAKEDGTYNLNYLAPGRYKVIAFDDQIENVLFDYGKEDFAFQEEPLVLTENAQINLKLFKQKPAYRVTKSEQKGHGHIVFKTQGSTTDVDVKPLTKDFKTAAIHSFQSKDSINFWFNPSIDSIEGKSQRLRFLLTHQDKTDTVSVLYTNLLKKTEMTVKSNLEGKLIPVNDYQMMVSAPVDKINPALINIFKDSIALPFTAKIDSVNKQLIRFDFQKNIDEKYEINIFPKAIYDITGKTNDTIALIITGGGREDFGNLKIRLTNAPTKPFLIQLYKKAKDYPLIKEIKAKPGANLFDFTGLIPNEYVLRILVDENENGLWDTGDFLNKLQPEPVYIYPNPIKVRAMWDMDETWIIGQAVEAIPFIPVDDERKAMQERRANIENSRK